MVVMMVVVVVVVGTRIRRYARYTLVRLFKQFGKRDTHFCRDEEEPRSRASACLLVHASRTGYNTDPHGKYALLVSAAANIDIRVYTRGRNRGMPSRAESARRRGLESPASLGGVIAASPANDARE